MKNVGVNNSKPAEIAKPKDVTSISMFAGNSVKKEVNQSSANISITNTSSQAPLADNKLKQHENQQNFYYHKNFRLKNLLSRQRIQQGIKVKLNRKLVMKWVARPPKDNNQQQNQAQATEVIQDIMQNYNAVIVDQGTTDGSKEVEVGKVHSEFHFPAIKLVSTSNSFQPLEKDIMERELISSEGMVKNNTNSNIASSNSTSGANLFKKRVGLHFSSADVNTIAITKDFAGKPKLDNDSANKIRTEIPSTLNSFFPSISGTPPKKVHNDV
ncbi:uncharacterized protein LOC132645067 isoform X1 [Lycium barbarum]|uniref:uncharacterized protein LOC132645067 isoform X1 n=1 Tax=Lycium barbarum TaxID=112863 RepID=UPI00293EF334|nr:uncharacterized protein LOC132645067 isoform X1 [Lycium barbarum]